MSTQIHQLEDSLGEPLFQRVGRKLILTAAGRMALEYAEEIFGLGAELQAAFGQGMESKPNRLNVVSWIHCRSSSPGSCCARYSHGFHPCDWSAMRECWRISSCG